MADDNPSMPTTAAESGRGLVPGRRDQKGDTMSKGSSTPMDREAADRIGEAAERDPDSATAISGFADRADAAADRNEDDD